VSGRSIELRLDVPPRSIACDERESLLEFPNGPIRPFAEQGIGPSSYHFSIVKPPLVADGFQIVQTLFLPRRW